MRFNIRNIKQTGGTINPMTGKAYRANEIVHANDANTGASTGLSTPVDYYNTNSLTNNSLRAYQSGGRMRTLDDIVTSYQKNGWESLSPEEQDWYRSNYGNIARVDQSGDAQVLGEDLPVIEVRASRPGKFNVPANYGSPYSQQGMDKVARELYSQPLQMMGVTGALAGEGVKGIAGREFNPMNALPSMLNPNSSYYGGNQEQTSVSRELGVENPVGAFAIDAITDPGLLFGAGKAWPIARKRTVDIGDVMLSDFYKPIEIDRAVDSSMRGYLKDVLSDENAKRAAAYDAKHGTKFSKRLEALKPYINKELKENIQLYGTGRHPLNISVSDVTNDAYLASDPRIGGYADRHSDVHFADFYKSRYNIIDPNTLELPFGNTVYNKSHKGFTPETVIPHELSHQIDQAGYIYTPSAEQEMKDFFYKDSEKAFDINNNPEDLVYLTKPTEIKSHLGVDLRDEMVKSGVLKDRFDELTSDKLREHYNDTKSQKLTRYMVNAGLGLQDENKQKKFIDWFNTIPLSKTGVIGAAGLAGYGATNRPQEAYGGYVGGATGNIPVATTRAELYTGLKDNSKNSMYFPNSNQMTMKGMTTPVKYYGVTDGKITDEGVAYPGQDFNVNGQDTVEFRMPTYSDGGIYIKPSKRGTFTAAAKRHGASVQEFASRVLANKDNYSPAMVKKANFARNSAKWNR